VGAGIAAAGVLLSTYPTTDSAEAAAASPAELEELVPLVEQPPPPPLAKQPVAKEGLASGAAGAN
jgi:hypothetical protein